MRAINIHHGPRSMTRALGARRRGHGLGGVSSAAHQHMRALQRTRPAARRRRDVVAAGAGLPVALFLASLIASVEASGRALQRGAADGGPGSGGAREPPAAAGPAAAAASVPVPAAPGVQGGCRGRRWRTPVARRQHPAPGVAACVHMQTRAGRPPHGMFAKHKQAVLQAAAHEWAWLQRHGAALTLTGVRDTSATNLCSQQSASPATPPQRHRAPAPDARPASLPREVPRTARARPAPRASQRWQQDRHPAPPARVRPVHMCTLWVDGTVPVYLRLRGQHFVTHPLKPNVAPIQIPSVRCWLWWADVCKVQYRHILSWRHRRRQLQQAQLHPVQSQLHDRGQICPRL